MPVKAEKNNGRTIVTLEGEATVAESSAIRDAFVEALESPAGVGLRMDDVELIDSAIVQLICMLKHEAMLKGKGFEVLSLSPVAASAINTYRLAPYLGIAPEDMPKDG